MSAPATVDELFEHLRRAGWQMSEKVAAGGWHVSGTGGGVILQAEGVSRKEAWQRAWDQSQAVDRPAHARRFVLGRSTGWRRTIPERALAALVAGLYLWACCSVVVRAGLSAGPFDLAAIYGWNCALTGWMDYPLGWLANPLIWAGVALLACRRPGAAALCGLLAVGPVAQWSVEWHRQ